MKKLERTNGWLPTRDDLIDFLIRDCNRLARLKWWQSKRKAIKSIKETIELINN